MLGAAPGTHSQLKSTMKRKWARKILAVVIIIVALPVALICSILGWAYLSDRTNGSVMSSGVERRYVIYVPKTYNGARPTPLVISIHPAATWPKLQMEISRWNDVADEAGFIVVYPAGTGAFFDGYSPGPHAWSGGRQDVQFITDLISKLQADYNIDPQRIYVNGMSNGGGMAYVLSCEIPDHIAAVGVVAGERPPVPGKDKCRDRRPIPAIAFHGTADKLAPYLGGTSPIAPRPFPSIVEWAAHAAKRNQCQSAPIETHISRSVRRLVYSNCALDADVVLYTIEGGGHTWPGGKHLAEWIAGRTTDEISASRLMWEFFAQHPLRK